VCFVGSSRVFSRPVSLSQDLLKARADKAASIRASEEAKASGYGAGGEGTDSLRAAASLNSVTAQRIAQVGRPRKNNTHVCYGNDYFFF
jgi:hypothetical protein